MRRLRVPFAVLVGSVWVGSWLVGLLSGNYEPFIVVVPLVMIVAGALYTHLGGNGSK